MLDKLLLETAIIIIILYSHCIIIIVELPIISDSNKTTEREKSIGTERV